ncbi:MAG: glycosyltransferase family 4 protein [Longispora sp.]|nr:glycosyltransferase family 4 protein [Longispora sp. (in: high G+C Gram-positive bacteria)]
MRAVVTTEARFLRTPDGRVWTLGGPARLFWERYLVAFDRVRVVGRVLDTPEVPDGAIRVDGGAVEVWAVPCYVGPQQYLLRWPMIRRTVRAAAGGEDAVILRVPSPIGSLLAAFRERQGLPYALEVVGDPYEVFAPGVVQHPLRSVLRRWSSAQLIRQCRRAIGVAYVTESALQKRYPAGSQAAVASFSSIELRPEAFVSEARVRRPHASTAQAYTLVSVGSLEQMYKGVDTLIEALSRLTAAHFDIHLTHVGDGRFRSELERLATRLAVSNRVTFTGIVPPGEAVRDLLDRADLFVMPSRTEGLPRALIEAMARGLPAVGSAVGGIPELLSAEHLVPPDDPMLLANVIGSLLTDPAAMAAASIRNLERACDFAEAPLAARRSAYYRTVHAATERSRAHSSAVRFHASAYRQ